MSTVRRTLGAHDMPTVRLPRSGLVLEVETAPGVFNQSEGPFRHYERTVTADGDVVRYQLGLPWFGWLFAPLVRRSLKRPDHTRGAQPRWAPPDRLTQQHVFVLGMLAAASLSYGFINTLFSQTASFAADNFGHTKTAQNTAAAVVRAGIVLVIPLAILADRIGRRRVIVWCAAASPVFAALGGLAPNFAVLTATQSVARPLGLCLDVLVGVVAAEVMPRNSRAYAVSVLSLATALGAGMAVWLLPLADVAPWGWRLVYGGALIWVVVAVDLARRMPESPRFIAPHADHPPTPRRRMAVLCAIAFFGNMFVAPASFMQNDYLREVRDYDGLFITIFTLSTAPLAGVGVLIGGQLADRFGRRGVGAFGAVAYAVCISYSYAVGGPTMWAAAAGAALFGGLAVPALGVYRTELFPTGRRSTAGLIVTISALIAGSLSLIVAGRIRDNGTSHAAIFGVLLFAEVVVAVIVLTMVPETAHRELEELNPEDRQTSPAPS